MRKFGLLFIVLFAVFGSGCALINQGAAAAIDGAKYYCANGTDLTRQGVRQALHSEAVAEDIEICLGCPGELQKTYCTGPSKEKVNDPLSQ